MKIKNALESLKLFTDTDARFLARDRQIKLFQSVIDTALIRAKSRANILVCNGVLLTNPDSVSTPDGSLRIGLNDFGLTSSLDETSIRLRPTSRLQIDGHAQIGRGCRIVLNEGAFFRMGNDSYIVGLSKVVCSVRIEIGEGTAISWGVQLLDTDFHEFNGKPASDIGISIGNDVLIGSNATILKNVTIGDGCVIGANAVVRESLPPRTMAIGNPAIIVREQVQWS